MTDAIIKDSPHTRTLAYVWSSKSSIYDLTIYILYTSDTKASCTAYQLTQSLSIHKRNTSQQTAEK